MTQFNGILWEVKKIIYFFTAPGCEAVVYNDSKVVL